MRRRASSALAGVLQRRRLPLSAPAHAPGAASHRHAQDRTRTLAHQRSSAARWLHDVVFVTPSARSALHQRPGFANNIINTHGARHSLATALRKS